MKKRDILIIVLAVLCVVSLALTACKEPATVESISLKAGSFDAGYIVGDTVSYANAKLIVKYSDDTEQEVALTADMVSPAISTEQVGTYTHTATYEGKTCTFTITVTNPVESISLKEGSFKAKYNVGEEVSFDNAKLVVKYENGDEEEISLTASMVSPAISTASAGTTTHTVTFGGKHCTFDIVVELKETIQSVTLPKSYQDYLSATSNLAPVTMEGYADNLDTYDGLFSKKAVYEVGNINAFRFELATRVINPLTGEKTVTGDFYKIKVSVKNTEEGTYTELTSDNQADYVTYDGTKNYYWFTEQAVGKYFKIEISIDTSKVNSALPANEKWTIEVKVVNGYNAYDARGLSVYDNRNNNSWRTLKDEKLDWDTKKLYEYTDVTNVVLHNSITIYPKDLPASYFWTGKEDLWSTLVDNVGGVDGDNNSGIKVDDIKGSLRNGISSDGWFNFGPCGSSAEQEISQSVLGDCWEGYRCGNGNKGLYTTTGCDVSGNFMTITVSEKRDDQGRIIKVYYGDDTKNGTATSHWAVFRDMEEDHTNNESHEFKNLHLRGNTGHSEATGPAGVVAFSMWMKEVKITNSVVQKVYVGVLGDQFTDVTFQDSKASDIASQMTYQWRSTSIVINSVLRDCGGPLFILCDSTRNTKDNGATFNTDASYPEMYVDNNSILENWVTGEESWFNINNASMIVGGVKKINAAIQGYLQRTIMSTKNSKEVFNCVAIIIPDPGDIGNGTQVDGGTRWLKGQFVRGTGTTKEEIASATDKEVIDVNDQLLNTPFIPHPQYPGVNVTVRQANSVLFASNGKYAFVSNADTYEITRITGYDDWTKASDLLGITTNMAGGPYISLIFGGVKSVG